MSDISDERSLVRGDFIMATTNGVASTLFVPDPAIRYLGTIEVSRDVFHALPDHPEQRQTALHAIDLLRSEVLNHSLDIHRNVDIHLVSDNLDELAAQITANPAQLIVEARQRGEAFKVNGHTRDQMWDRGLAPAPEMLRVTIWGVQRNSSGATRLYKAFDALAAVKGKKDEMQSTLKAAGIDPTSDAVRKATNLAPALLWATAVICGSIEYRNYPLELLTDGPTMTPFDQEIHKLLPKLGTVKYYRQAIMALDQIDINPEMMPVLPAVFIGGYVSILHRNPVEGLEFLRRLKDSESGETNGTLMDAFAAIKKVRSYVMDPARYRQTKPLNRQVHILNSVLNAFIGWHTTENHAYTVDAFPFRPNAISSFNPVLRSQAQTFDRATARQRAELTVRRQAERISARQRRHQQLEQPQPGA
jgi:hypothetical protein